MRLQLPPAPPFIAGSSKSRTSPFEGEDERASRSPAANVPLGGETGSCLSYKQMSKVRLLPERPFCLVA